MNAATARPAVRNTAEPGSAKLALTLGLAGLLSGVAIVAAYEATRSTIAENQAAELRQAVLRVLPGTSTFRELVYEDGVLQILRRDGEGEDVVYAGYDQQGQRTGYAIQGKGPGFQDTIRLLYGYLPEQQLIVGMEVLESRETPGLGDKIYKDADFRRNFERLKAVPEVVSVKKGKRSAPNEVDAITGATISSVAVVRIINSAHNTWQSRLTKTGATTSEAVPAAGNSSRPERRDDTGTEIPGR
jgi:electron transport complex protein RnfG